MSPIEAVPVVVQGWTWTSTLMAVANVLLGSVFVALIRTRPTLKKLANEREANLLMERAAEMESMRKRIALLEAQRSVDRHEINNLNQCLDALLLLIELNPEKVKEGAAKVKAMREQQARQIATEKGAVHAARVADADGETG